MDDLDHKIVQLLSENARMPVKDIAQKVSLTSPAVSSRIHRLEQEGIIGGYTVVLRKALPDEEEANVALFFGYVGLLCSAVFAPVVALLAGVGALHLKSIPPQAYLIILVQGEAGWLG